MAHALGCEASQVHRFSIENWRVEEDIGTKYLIYKAPWNDDPIIKYKSKSTLIWFHQGAL